MFASSNTNWTSYAISGALAIVVSWALSGCRFGNQVVDTNAATQDTVTGFYETAPQKAEFCASGSWATPAERCKDGSTNGIPSEIANVMSNPVGLAVLDMSTGESVLVNPTYQKYQLPIYIDDAHKELGILGTFNPDNPWKADTNCTHTSSLAAEGTRSDGGPYNSGFDTSKLRGRIQLDLEMIDSFEGDCASALQNIALCYSDVSKCGESSATANTATQNTYKAIFQPFIEAGAITVDEVGLVSKLAIKIGYE